MKDELKLLKKEFERIKKMGYVESTRNGTTGIGKTFEDLIGKAEDSIDEPDFHGIEIKTKRGYNKRYISLFCAAPKGLMDYEIKRLTEKYGYPDKVLREYKVFRAIACSGHLELVANRYLFSLKVDYENRKLFVGIFDRNFKLIEMSTYWDFDLLEDKLKRKLSYLALIKAWPNKVNGKDYYKYYDIIFYKLRGFEQFISLIEDGSIAVLFNVGIYRTGEKIGLIEDHGTTFRIKEKDLNRLFERIIV